MWDLAIAKGEDGEMMVHRANCPSVRAQAANGEPVMTMLGCRRLPSRRKVKWHECLDNDNATRAN